MNNYEALLTCYRSGQISEKQWQQHLKDEIFCKWLEKRKPLMPYTKKQCKAFGAKSGRGERVPADWKKHCRKKVVKKVTRRKK